jgi:hypothetical protein
MAILKGGTTVKGSIVETQNNKGVSNGYAGLDANGKVPAEQLPASSGGGLPSTGVTWNQLRGV